MNPQPTVAETAPAAKPGLLDRLQPVLGLLVVAGAVAWIARDWEGFSEALSQFRPASLVWLAGPLLVSSLSGAFAWRIMAAAAGHPVPWTAAIRIWTLSQLGQYIPGTLWFAAGRVYLAGRLGVPAKVVGAITVLEAISWLGLGIVMTLVLAPVAGVFLGPEPVLIAGGTVAAVVAVYASVPPLRRRAAARWKSLRAKLPDGPVMPAMAAMVGLHALSWTMCCVAFAGLTASVHELAPAELFRAAVVFLTASTAGTLIFLLPQGLGTREAVIAAGTAALMNASPTDAGPIALAAAARAVFSGWDALYGLTVAALSAICRAAGK